MDYPKSTPGVGLVNGEFADENPSLGVIGSLIPASWGNAVTNELLGVIKAAGIVPSEDDVNQLVKAIQTIAATDAKRSVRCATTGPIALTGLQTVDGVLVAAGDRVLVKNQQPAAQNWIYVAGPAAWDRAQDANESIECIPGHIVPVQAGTVNGGTQWQLTNTSLPTLGTTALTFAQVQGRTGVAAGSYNGVTVDAFGRVLSGRNPTTVEEYGITDALRVGQTSYQRPVLAALEIGGDDGSVRGGAIEIREAQEVGASNQSFAYAPRMIFHWTGVFAGAIAMNAGGHLSWNGKRFLLDGELDLSTKADKATTLLGYGITDAYNRVDTQYLIAQAVAPLAGKADKASTLGGYGIVDAFTQAQTNAAIQAAISALVNGAGPSLDTLQELAAALGNDANFAATVTNQLAGKAAKATTLAGYGITNAHTKTDTEYLIDQAVGALLPKRGFLANDFIRIPDVPGGLILQMGTTSVGPEGVVDVTLPLAFNAGRGAIAGIAAAGASDQGNTSAYATLVSNQTLRLTQDVSTTTQATAKAVSWFAWGV